MQLSSPMTYLFAPACAAADICRLQSKSNEEVVETICIYIFNHAGKKIPKLAVLWYPGGNDDANLISPKLVREVLHLDIQTDEKTRSGRKIPFQGRMLDTQGHVDLEWGFERSSKRRTTRFVVISQYDPPFDVLLGRKTAIECGLA